MIHHIQNLISRWRQRNACECPWCERGISEDDATALIADRFYHWPTCFMEQMDCISLAEIRQAHEEAARLVKRDLPEGWRVY